MGCGHLPYTRGLPDQFEGGASISPVPEQPETQHPSMTCFYFYPSTMIIFRVAKCETHSLSDDVTVSTLTEERSGEGELPWVLDQCYDKSVGCL